MSARATAAATASAMKQAAPWPPTTAQNYWQPLTRQYEFDRESFRLTAFRKNRPNLNLDPLIYQFNWQRQGAQPRTGTMSFYRPLGVDEADWVAQADQIGVDISLAGADGPWYRMLRMAVSNPQETVVAGVVSLNLTTINIAQMTKSKTSWRYGRDPSHPKGWTARQVTVAACRAVGARVGHVPETGNYLPALVDKNASAYDVIIKAWQAERQISGRRYVIDDDVGAVEVTEIGTPRYMLALGPALGEATLTSFDANNFASAVQVTGHATTTRVKTTVSPVKHKTHEHVSRKKTPLQVLVIDQDRIDRYGYVQKTVAAPSHIQTAAGLRAYGQRYLARFTTPQPSIEITYPGIPWVDVGSAIQLTIPQISFDNLVYVQTDSHSVGPGQYTMDLTLAYSDPWLADQSSKVSAAKRARGQKVATPSHYLSASTRPVADKAKVHSGGAKKA